MSGLDKMVSQIIEEANHLAEKSLADASKERTMILDKANAEAKTKVNELQAKMEADIAYQEERIRSSSERQRRKILLQERQNLIADILRKAYESLVNLDTDEYFALLSKMLEKYTLPKEGILYLKKEDLDRITPEFATEVAKIAALSGGSLEIQESNQRIDGGFILAYGGIEENCTFKAMLAAKRESLSDLVDKFFFQSF